MRKTLVVMGLSLGLCACSDPLAGLQKIDEVDLPQSNAAAAALPTDAEVAREGFLGTDAATAPVAGATAAETATVAPLADADMTAVGAPLSASSAADTQAVAPARTGLLGLLRRAVPQGSPAADSQATAVAQAVAASQSEVMGPTPTSAAATAAPSDTQIAALAPPVDATAAAPAPKRSGLFQRLSKEKAAADAPRKGPDARDVSYGTIVPFGVVARVCEAKGKSLGKRVEKAPAKGFALYDSSQGSAGARTWYVTGFSDGCPRQLTGANVLLGSASLYEQLHFGPGGDNLPYGVTDKAYEGVKRKVCGARKGKPCGSKISKMEKSTFFITGYERFGNSSRWSELLIHDGNVIAAAIKPN